MYRILRKKAIHIGLKLRKPWVKLIIGLSNYNKKLQQLAYKFLNTNHTDNKTIKQLNKYKMALILPKCSFNSKNQLIMYTKTLKMYWRFNQKSRIVIRKWDQLINYIAKNVHMASPNLQQPKTVGAIIKTFPINIRLQINNKILLYFSIRCNKILSAITSYKIIKIIKN